MLTLYGGVEDRHLLTVKRSSHLVVVAAVCVAFLLAIGGCGGGDSSGSGPTAVSGEASPTASTPASDLPTSPTPTTPPDCGPTAPAVTGGPSPIGLGLISTLELSGGGLVKKGDDVQMTLVLTNCGDNAAHLYFPTSQRYVFIVQRYDTLEEVWRSSDGKSYDAVLGDETINPGQTVKYAETWDQKNADGDQVALGRYKVLAFSVGCATRTAADCKFGPVGGIQINE